MRHIRNDRAGATVTPARLLGTTLLLLTAAAARGDGQPPAREATTVGVSVMAGGMIVGDSRLAITKASIARGRWALMLDLTRDDTRESWDVDDSSGEYVLWGLSAQLRRYSRDGERGFFAEAGAGSAKASLRVIDAEGGHIDRAASLPMATWGIGGRFGIGSSTSFIEVGFRSAIALRERHLHADATPPEGSTDDFVTYHSWYFKQGRATGQPYLGIGLRF